MGAGLGWTGVTTLVSFQANATFDALGRLRELVELWDELGPRVWDFFQDGPQVEALRVSPTPRRDGGDRRRRRRLRSCPSLRKSCCCPGARIRSVGCGK